MNIWLTADTHFSHRKMEEYCDRPKDFEIRIYKAFKQIQKEDLLIHLGDICIGNDEKNHEKFIRYLLCKKWLVKGNHDRKSNNWYLEHGWDFVCNSFTDTYFGKHIVFSHEPILAIKEDVINIHGHFHNANYRKCEPQFKGSLTDNHKLLALEYTNYQPITLKSFLTKQP